MTRLRSSVSVDPIGPADEGALRSWFGIEQAARAADLLAAPPPCWVEHRARLAAPWPGEDTRAWLARVDGLPAGAALLALPTRDNLDNATGEVLVHPAMRRRGAGRALLAVLADQAREAGRVRLIVEVRAPLTGDAAGVAFAEAAGAACAQEEIERRLILPGDTAAWRALAAEAGAGYPLTSWTGDTPPEWQADVARLEQRMSTDAPHDDLHWSPEVHDAARVRERDAMCRSRGIQVATTAAVGPDGRLVAYTEISMNATVPDHADTWNTLVVPEHRGRRLGLRVKVAALTALQERAPAVRAITTWNAASNRYMIAINEALGFRASARLFEYELPL